MHLMDTTSDHADTHFAWEWFAVVATRKPVQSHDVHDVMAVVHHGTKYSVDPSDQPLTVNYCWSKRIQTGSV